MMSGMSKTSRSLRVLAPIVAVAAVLAFLAVGIAQAEPDFKSEDYAAQVELTQLDVVLTENRTEREGDNALLGDLIPQGENVKFGYVYDEKLAALNKGKEPEYVRVVVNRYWMKDGKKNTELSPELIELGFNTEDWVIDTQSTTREQTILYSKHPVEGGDEKALVFVKTLRVNPDILGLSKMTTEKAENGTTYSVMTYDYAGCSLGLDVEVSSVQTHNASDAMKSAWGVDPARLGLEVA